MIRLLRFAFAAWAVVFALHATALAEPELHALEAYEGGSKQAEDQFINFLAGFRSTRRLGRRPVARNPRGGHMHRGGCRDPRYQS